MCRIDIIMSQDIMKLQKLKNLFNVLIKDKKCMFYGADKITKILIKLIDISSNFHEITSKVDLL